MTPVVRPIVEADFESLLTLFQEFAHFEKRPDQMTNTLDRMMEDKEHIKGFVVENMGSGLVGYVTYFYTFHTWSGKSMYMDDLYVQKEYRGQGLGRQLLEAVISEARASNCQSLRWLVSNWNAEAMDFYKSIGASITNNEHHCELKLN